MESERLAYDFPQLDYFVKGRTNLFPAVLDDDLFMSSTKFEVPFYIVQGDHDYMVSQALAEKYFDVIDAPAKEYYSFSNSAHSPNMEEPEKIIEIFRNIALEDPGKKY